MWALCLFLLAGAEAFCLPAIAFGRAAEHVTWETTTRRVPETDIQSLDVSNLSEHTEETSNVDSLKARADVLKQRILHQQVELQRLERRLVDTDDLSWIGFSVKLTLWVHSEKDSGFNSPDPDLADFNRNQLHDGIQVKCFPDTLTRNGLSVLFWKNKILISYP